MSGFLHRLAAQAMGRAWTVRTDARLPFGAAPLHDIATEPVAETRATALEDAVPERAAPRTSTAFALPPAASAAHAPPETWHSAVDASATARFPLGPEASARDAAQPAAHHASAADPHRPPAAARAGATQAFASATAMRGVAPALARPTHTTPDAPAPLLPPAYTPAPPASSAAAPDGRGMPPAGQDTEVHIHIGRIDVTAVPAAPPAKANPPARAPQPEPLDTYLARKGNAR